MTAGRDATRATDGIENRRANMAAAERVREIVQQAMNDLLTDTEQHGGGKRLIEITGRHGRLVSVKVVHEQAYPLVDN